MGGGYSQIQVELDLLKKAVSLGKHSYYHLLSGADLPLKSIHVINQFFEDNKGKEFVNFDDPKRFKAQYEMRLKYKHYFREKCGRNKNIFTVANKIGWIFQKQFNICNKQTIPESEFVFGANWFDITQNFAEYVLNNQANIKKWFSDTSCADEVFIQYLIWNSKFRDNLYRPYLNNGKEGNMRYVDFSNSKNAGANIINDFNVDAVLKSGMIFGRKFDINRYPGAVYKVIDNYEI